MPSINIKVVIILLSTTNLLLAQQDILSERITMKFENQTLGQALETLSLKTGLEFSYSSNKIPAEKTITESFTNERVDKIISTLVKDLPVMLQHQGNRIILKPEIILQTVRGRIVDADSRGSLYGATVVILGTDPLLGASTDENGNFRIEQVPLGRWTIRVQSVGYQQKELTNILVNAGKEVVLEIPVSESVTTMREIEIEGVTAGSIEPVNELATVSARSFTEEETRRYAASVGDPARLVTAYAGVVQGDDGSNEIIIRGNSARGLLWKLEGVEIPSPNHFSSEGAATGGISMFSTQMIARSDFLTGAFPAEYGNALSGVFDIKFRKGNDEKKEYTLQAGLLGLDVAMEGPFQNGGSSSYLFNYRYSTLGLLNGLGFNLQDEDESNTFQDLSFKMYFPTKKAGNFSLFGLGGLSIFEENVAGEFKDLERYNMGVLGITHDYFFNQNTYLKSVLSWSGTLLEDDIHNLRVFPEVAKSDTDFTKSYLRAAITVGKKINARHLVELGSIYSGLRYDFQTLSINTFREDPIKQIEWFKDHDNSGSWQGFGNYKYQVNDKLSLITGLHVLHFNFNGETTFEPRAGLRWQFRSNQELSAGFGVHSRIESLEYYLGRFVDPDGSISQFNRDLEVTKARHYVLGYGRRFSGDWSMKLETYYQDLYDVPVVVDAMGLDDPTIPAYASILFFDGYTSLPLANKGSATNYGVELTLEKAFSNQYFLLITGSLYDAKYKGADGVERNSRLNGRFNNTVLAGKEFSVGPVGKNTVGINIRSNWAGNQRYTPVDVMASIETGHAVYQLEDVYREQYPNYYRLDLQLSYRKNKSNRTSEWRLDIQNLTDQSNVLQQLYSEQSQRIFYENQLGLIPVLSYRIQF